MQDTIINRECRHCGKPFFAITLNSQYCSAECRQASFRGRERAKAIVYNRECPVCSHGFQSTDPRKIYCSKACNFAAQNAKRETTKLDKRECPQCKKQFIPMQKRGVGKTYCSSTCQRKFNYDKNTQSMKERRSAWAKKNKWGGNWEAALDRDRYTCQMCNKQLYPSQWSGKRRLEVHHKDGSGETNNKNHSLDNLVTLCFHCHREFHTKINLVQINGEYFVRGNIFKFLGLDSIKTLTLNT